MISLVGIPSPLKNDGVKVSWDDEIPNMGKSKPCSKPPTSLRQHYVLATIPKVAVPEGLLGFRECAETTSDSVVDREVDVCLLLTQAKGKTYWGRTRVRIHLKWTCRTGDLLQSQRPRTIAVLGSCGTFYMIPLGENLKRMLHFTTV